MAKRIDSERYFSEGRGVRALWTGLLAGPIAWALHLQISYSITPFFHGAGSTLALYLVTLAALLSAAAGGWIAWRNWSRAGPEWPGGEEGGVLARSRFMAVAGLAFSAFFFLVILAQAVPIVILRS